MKNHAIQYNNHRIVLSHERIQKATLDIYPLHHLLTYVREGVLQVKHGDKLMHFKAGEFVLLKKYTSVTITKTWEGDDTRFSSFVFSFHEDLIREAFLQLDPLKSEGDMNNIMQVVPVKANPILKQFIQSLQLFFNENIEMDQNLARLKTTEALLGILKTDASLAKVIWNFSIRSKADLFSYMKHHFLENKRLEDFARESGRSLSTFKKDFQEVFHTPPALWLKLRRLEHAYKLLSTTPRKASDIYQECGFEDLAHFSRTFKQHFHINPSELSQASQASKLDLSDKHPKSF